MKDLFGNGAVPAKSASITRQFATFYVADRLYGIDVTQVQEIANPLPLPPVRLSPTYVAGLINLRGQIATAIGLRELFGLPADAGTDKMSVVCRLDGALVSLLVDQIGDVMELPDSAYEPSPETLPEATRRFMHGVYKTPQSILSVLDINHLTQFLSK